MIVLSVDDPNPSRVDVLKTLNPFENSVSNVFTEVADRKECDFFSHQGGQRNNVVQDTTVAVDFATSVGINGVPVDRSKNGNLHRLTCFIGANGERFMNRPVVAFVIF